ncbi:prepilin peptidase [Leifsonia sp. F6_8S_P_1B]|uniref:Prepilin peptidase n=1 Tax=Leifsonia williamsii TaxID=3035919 RepID=A0ABT8KEC8_9MICO|nr:prepilin peptidase [Leifsonia williamsii]MDN4615806.1 prepilin peptidase [Leifsonia williamsii]
MGKNSPEGRLTAASVTDLVVGAALVILLVVARGGVSPGLVGAAYAAAVAARLVRTDVREHRLPNALVLPGFAFAAVGLVWDALARGSPEALGAAVVLGVAVGGALLVLASGGGLGMGDVKLATLLVVALVGVCAGGGDGGAGGSALSWAALSWAALAASAGTAVVAFVGAAFLAGGLAGVAALVGAGAWSRHDEVAFGPVLLASFLSVAVLS